MTNQTRNKQTTEEIVGDFAFEMLVRLNEANSAGEIESIRAKVEVGAAALDLFNAMEDSGTGSEKAEDKVIDTGDRFRRR